MKKRSIFTRTKRKRIIAGALGMLIGNQAVYPILQTQAVNNRFSNESREIIDTGNFDPECLAQYKNLRGIDYLNLAHKSVVGRSNENHWCRHYAEAVFDTYMKIIKSAGREDLKDKIALSSNVQHIWIRYNHEDEWLDFETGNRNCVAKDISSLAEFSDTNIETRSYLAGGRHYPHSKSKPGTKEFYPVPESIKFPGGALRLIVEAALEKLMHNGG